MGRSPDEQTNRKPAQPVPNKPSYGGIDNSGSGEELDWTMPDQDLLTATIADVNRAGDAISFASGSHGRWLSFTVLTSDGKHTKRATSVAEANDLLREVQRVARQRA